jgi:hypothetical protein
MFLNSVISHLISFGSEDACNALEDILHERPKLDWIASAILRCRENLRRRVWQVPTPTVLLRMLEDSQNRLIRNGDDLLQVLMASIDRYQKNLLLEDLWNTRPCNTPKSEKHLSNHLIRHLHNDLRGRNVIANREVEIETFGHGTEGERVDILVETFIRDQRKDTIKVVIEVKGCWNKHLLTSMEAQLANGYLTDKGISHGIYCVGWFLCPAWKGPDKGRLTVAESWNLTVESAIARLDFQAADLSRADRSIKAFVLDVRWQNKGRAKQQPSGQSAKLKLVKRG